MIEIDNALLHESLEHPVKSIESHEKSKCCCEIGIRIWRIDTHYYSLVLPIGVEVHAKRKATFMSTKYYRASIPVILPGQAVLFPAVSPR